MSTKDVILVFIKSANDKGELVRYKDILDFVKTNFNLNATSIGIQLTNLKKDGLIYRKNTFENKYIYYYFLKEE